MQYRQPFFFNDTATTEIYTLSLPDALPIAPAGEVEDDEVVFCHVGEALDEAGDGVRGFERRNDSFGAREQARRIERRLIGYGPVFRAALVRQPGMFWADRRIVEASGNRMR